MNTYTMHYDYDEQRVRDSFAGENGNWVHVVAARQMQAEIARLRAEAAELVAMCDADAYQIGRLQAEVERLNEAGENVHALMREKDAECARLRAELATSESERLEQARLLGMSAERELALRAEVEQYKQDAKRYFWLRQRGRTPPIENVITITVPDPMRGGLDFAVDACVLREAAALGGGEARK